MPTRFLKMTTSFVFFILVAFSPVSYSGDWLVNVSREFVPPAGLDTHPVYTFFNGDRLLRIDEPIFIDYSPALIANPNVNYIEKAPSLVHEKQPQIRAARTASYQDHLANDRFTALSASERQCDLAPIAILDSGVDTTHDAFASVNFANAFDTITQTQESQDPMGHGTHVAGLIAASATVSEPALQGACTTASIYPIRFLDRFGGGTLANAIEGIQWAIDNDAKIINHSWAIGSKNQALFDVLSDANARGIVQVTAAANAGKNLTEHPYYPAAYSSQLTGLISVANWDHDNQALYYLSNYSAEHVDIAASGTNLLSTLPDNRIGTKTGTSMATPLVASAAAMLMQQYPRLTAAQVKAHLVQNAKQEQSLQGRVVSSGRLDANAAMNTSPLQPFMHHSDIVNNQLIVFGVNLHQITNWRFVTATSPSQVFSISPTFVSNEQVRLDMKPWPVGWIEGDDSDNNRLHLLVKPELSAPTDLKVLTQNDTSILTWRGSDLAGSYRVTWRLPGMSYDDEQVVKAPANQFLLPNDVQIAAIKVREEYAYTSDREHLDVIDSVYTSAYNELTIMGVGGDNIVDVGIIPQHAFGQLPLVSLPIIGAAQHYLVPNHKQPLFTAINGNIAVLDTEENGSKESTLEVVSDTGISYWSFSGEVSNVASWQLAMSDTNWVAINAGGAEVASAFRHADKYTLNLSPAASSGNIVVTLTQDNPDERYEISDIKVDGATPNHEQVSTRGAITTIVIPDIDTQDVVTVTFAHAAIANPFVAVSSDSRCFIASMVFEQHSPALDHLRFLRDHVIKPLPYGQALIDYYYASSPFWVENVKNNPLAVAIIRSGIVFFLYLLPLLLLFGLVTRQRRMPSVRTVSMHETTRTH